MPRMTLKLPIDERNALYKLAAREYRNPREQAALIIRRELERAGLLPGAVDSAETQLLQPTGGQHGGVN